MDAILRNSLAEMEDFGIRRILTHSEKAAAYMADGYCRVSRKPTVCMAQSVGAANLAAGLQDAYFAGSGLIAMTGRHVAEKQYRNAYQELPHEAMFAEVTKFSARAESPKQFALLLRQAFREASTGNVRPVHLDVAGNTGSVLDQSAGDIEVVPEPEYGRIPAWRLRPDTDALDSAVDAISSASRPVIIAGIGAVTSDAGSAIQKIAEKLDIPVAGALDAKAILTADHPLNAGAVGTYSHEYANKFVAEADCAIFVGCDTGDQVTNNWTLPRRNAAVVHIDNDPSEPGRNFAGSIALVGDPQATIAELESRLPGTQRPEWVARLATLSEEWRQLQGPFVMSDSVPIRPERLCADLSKWLPSDAIVVADTGYSSQWAGTFVDLNHSGQQFIRAAGSLGWSFPASLGAKCAAPQSTVICFTGDGGFMYHLPELETAKRWNIKTITIVNNNSRLAQGLRNLLVAYEGRDKSRMHELFEFEQTNFAEIARSFDCVGIRVTDPANLGAALDEAQSEPGPVVIDVVTDPSVQASLPWTPT